MGAGVGAEVKRDENEGLASDALLEKLRFRKGPTRELLFMVELCRLDCLNERKWEIENE